MLAFRSGISLIRIPGAGYNFKDVNSCYVLEGGMEVHFSFHPYFYPNPEVTFSTLTQPEIYDAYTRSSARLIAAFKLPAG